MTEHRCQYVTHWDKDGVFLATFGGRSSYLNLPACGKLARFQVGHDWWFCADHYDLWVSFHGVPDAYVSL